MVAQLYDDPVTPRWTALRALIWKEWRQQRLIALAMPLGTIAVCLLFTLIWEGQVGAVAAMILGVATLVTLAANAFSGETDDRTGVFLAALPWPRGRLFWVKFGVTLAIAVAAAVAMAITVLCVTTPALRHEPVRALHFFTPPLLPVTAACVTAGVLVCIVTLAWAAVVASAGAGALLTFLVTVLLGGLTTTVHVTSTSLLFSDYMGIHGNALGVLTFSYCAWVTAVTLVGGWWLWSTTWPSRFHWLGAVVLVIFTPLLTPVIALIGVALLIVFGPPAAAGVLTSIICWQRPDADAPERNARGTHPARRPGPTGTQDNKHDTEVRRP